MDGRIMILISVCAAAAVGAIPAISTPTPQATTPVTKLLKQTDSEPSTTTRDLPPPDAFYSWLAALKPGPATEGANQQTTEGANQQTAEGANQQTTKSAPVESTDLSSASAADSDTPGMTNETGTETSTRLFPLDPGTEVKGATDATRATTAKLNEDEDLEWLMKMFPESGAHNETETETEERQRAAETGSTQTGTHKSHQDRHKHRNFDLPPPDEFFDWLNSLRPNSTSNHKMDSSETSSKIDPPTDHPVFLTTKLIVFISVASGILVILVLVVSAYVIIQRKRSGKARGFPEAVTPVKPVGEVYYSGTTDVFHGIPTNNDIWKNLDMLTVNAPSVLPECEKKV